MFDCDSYGISFGYWFIFVKYGKKNLEIDGTM